MKYLVEVFKPAYSQTGIKLRCMEIAEHEVFNRDVLSPSMVSCEVVYTDAGKEKAIAVVVERLDEELEVVDW